MSYYRIRNDIDIMLITKEGETLVATRTGNINYKSMVVGQIYGYSYTNLGDKIDIFRFMGFSDVNPKYGEGGPVFEKISQVFDKYGGSNLKHLENINATLNLEYGHGVYMCMQDLEDNSTGCYFYPFEGHWSRGSGADKMSFFSVGLVK